MFSESLQLTTGDVVAVTEVSKNMIMFQGFRQKTSDGLQLQQILFSKEAVKAIKHMINSAEIDGVFDIDEEDKTEE